MSAYLNQLDLPRNGGAALAAMGAMYLAPITTFASLIPTGTNPMVAGGAYVGLMGALGSLITDQLMYGSFDMMTTVVRGSMMAVGSYAAMKTTNANPMGGSSAMLEYAAGLALGGVAAEYLGY